MRSISYWMFVAMLTLSGWATAGRSENPAYTRQEDVIYGRKFGTALTMDVFTPTREPNGAGVIFVVSGGWFSSHEHINPQFVEEFLRRGYAVFAVVHGSQPKFTIPEILGDMHRAVRFIRYHAEKYGIDPNRLGITGGSAGGHLSLMQGTAGTDGNPKAKDPVDRVSSRVQAVACFFPPTDFLNYGKKGEIALGRGVLKNYRAPFDFKEYDAKVNVFRRITDESKILDIGREISPITHVTPDDPPTLIVHGDADKLVPIQQAKLIIDKLKAADVPAELVVKKGKAHGWKNLQEDMPILADWFDKYLSRTRPRSVRHVTVYREKGRFGGWPANHGIWCWGDEILVGFSRGYYKDLGNRHHIDREKPEEHLLARSLDGGETWSIENPGEQGVLIGQGPSLHGTPVPGLREREETDCPGGINFTHPDFAMTVRMTSVDAGRSRFYTSTDRGRTWSGPFTLPLFGQKGIAARTDYIVNGKHDCMLFLTAAKRNGREGRPLCVRTTDGGKTWRFVSWIGEEPSGFSIMPSTVRTSERELLTTVRRREGSKRWIDAYLSEDNGQTWRFLNRPVKDAGEGNPPSMIRLRDGRICLTYGYRAAPFGIRARLSKDNGRTWEPVITLRDDGGGRDLGYPRTVQRADGKIVTVYYFNDRGDDPTRYIAATIWDANVE